MTHLKQDNAEFYMQKPSKKYYTTIPSKICLGALNNFDYLLYKGGIQTAN